MSISSSLSARRTLGVQLGLGSISAVYEALGRPCASRPTVHVVGTNGKGSTTMLLEHALRGRGLRTGLYTSPHLHRLSERVRVDSQPLGEIPLRAVLDRVLDVERTVGGPRALTFFEVLTLAGLLAFEQAEVDVAIVEAGLGGGRDATRVVSATAVGITSIALDHEATIGPTLVDIAKEKAGAMALGVPTISARQDPVVMEVLQAQATALGSPLHWVEALDHPPRGLRGDHQRTNAAVALSLGRRLVRDLDEQDFDGVVLPGRLECLSRSRGELWLDVAHNPAGMASVAAAISGGIVPNPHTVVLGWYDDKDRAGMLDALRMVSARQWWVPPRPRPEGVGPPPPLGMRAFTDVRDPGLYTALDTELGAGRRVLCCGSHGVVGAIRAWAHGDSTASDAQDPWPGRP